MLRAILFALTYLRNLPEFDGHHVRTLAATRMDMDLRRARHCPLCQRGGKP